MDNTDREGEEALFEIIRSPSPDENEEDDSSQYMKNTGEGIFDEDQRIDDFLQITKTGEVYLYKASGDHHIFYSFCIDIN